MSFDGVVGIDLGTTNSAMAIINSRGQPEVVPNAEGKRITPSVVQIRPDGTALVGESAKQEIVIEKENSAVFFKRDMGTSATYEYRGRIYSPVDLSAEVLKKLKMDGETALAIPIRRAVITVPAYFQDGARVATRTAGEMAGLEVVQIISEPTAAALAYGLKHEREEIVLVYDLGGGTFDISLVRIAADGIEVVGTDGNHTLGGKDWDDRLVQYLCDEFRQRQGIDPLDDAYTFQELLIRAEEAKKALSERTKAIVPVNCQGRMDRIEITREQFEAITKDLLAQTEHLIGKVLEETRFAMADISSLLMVGGSTRMPMCAALVRRLAGKDPNTAVNPDECVAVGAAIQGAMYANTRPIAGLRFSLPENIRDVMSHSMGMVAISADGERYVNSVLIPKNTIIPCRETRPYQVATRDGRDNSASVFVTQGEGDDPSNSSFVGKYVIGEINHVKRKPAILDIIYEYDRSGVVNISATERSTGGNLPVTKEPIPEDMSWVSRSPKEAALAHKTVYLVVDISGSMAGQPLDDAKRAAKTFVEKSDLAHTSIGLISFESTVQVDQPATQDARALQRTIRGWTARGGTQQPLQSALDALVSVPGPRFLVVLTDGQWAGQEDAERCAAECRRAGIEIIATGFGGADEAFLRRIATSDQAALYSDSAQLVAAFGQIAQVLVENDASSGAGRLSWLKQR